MCFFLVHPKCKETLVLFSWGSISDVLYINPNHRNDHMAKDRQQSPTNGIKTIKQILGIWLEMLTGSRISKYSFILTALYTFISLYTVYSSPTNKTLSNMTLEHSSKIPTTSTISDTLKKHGQAAVWMAIPTYNPNFQERGFLFSL